MDEAALLPGRSTRFPRVKSSLRGTATTQHAYHMFSWYFADAAAAANNTTAGCGPYCCCGDNFSLGWLVEQSERWLCLCTYVRHTCVVARLGRHPRTYGREVGGACHSQHVGLGTLSKGGLVAEKGGIAVSGITHRLCMPAGGMHMLLYAWDSVLYCIHHSRGNFESSKIATVTFRRRDVPMRSQLQVNQSWRPSGAPICALMCSDLSSAGAVMSKTTRRRSAACVLEFRGYVLCLDLSSIGVTGKGVDRIPVR